MIRAHFEALSLRRDQRLQCSTAGQGQAFGWIDELSSRPQNRRFRFRNLGVGGDLAYSALQRLHGLAATHPDKVVILLGANDVLALVFKNVRRLVGGLMKHIPMDPSPEWFEKNLETIVRRVNGADRRSRKPAHGEHVARGER